MSRSLGTLAVCVATGLVVAACSSATNTALPATEDATDVVETIPTTVAQETSTSTTITATTAVDAEGATTTTTSRAEALMSDGNVTINEVQYDFTFECFAPGGDDVVALGVGQSPDGDVGTQAIVQAIAGVPFVSVLVEGQQTLELQLDAPAELFVQDGVIRGTALRFVDAGAEVGVGDPLGLGEVTVSCVSFMPGLPDGFDAS